MLSYLCLLDLEHGKLVNLRTTRVESRFVNATIPRSERIRFRVCRERYSGGTRLVDLVVGIVRDWGTCLSLSLYQEAVTHLLGGPESVVRLLPVTRNGITLGNQRFHLANDCEAFQFTAITKSDEDYEQQLRRLLLVSPLQAIHRINIDTHCLAFSTVRRT